MSRHLSMVVVRVLAIAIPATVLWFLLRAVPFSWTSYVAWTAILLLPILMVAILHPLPWLWLPTRATSLRALLLALIALGTALTWPVSSRRVIAPVTLLDKYAPEFEFSEYHAIEIPARTDEVWSALQTINLSDLPAMEALGRLRALAFGRMPRFSRPVGAQPMLATILQPSSAFFLLGETPGEEIAIGMAGRPWQNKVIKLAGGPEFLGWSEPDSVRIAFNFRAEPVGDRTRLITETRIHGMDADGATHFSRYWRLVYPGSAIIRYQGLQAVAQRARGLGKVALRTP